MRGEVRLALRQADRPALPPSGTQPNESPVLGRPGVCWKDAPCRRPARLGAAARNARPREAIGDRVGPHCAGALTPA